MMDDERERGLVGLLRSIREAAGSEAKFDRLIELAKDRRRRRGRPRGSNKTSAIDYRLLRRACELVLTTQPSPTPSAAIERAIDESWRPNLMGATRSGAKRRLLALVSQLARCRPRTLDEWITTSPARILNENKRRTRFAK